MTMFFSSRHLTPKAAQLQETLAALEESLTLRRDREGELRVGPMEKGMRVRLPDNALVRDLVTVQERKKTYEYAEYVVHSYYVECHELYDHAGAHLDFVSGSMPLFGLMGTVLGLISMFDSLGGVVTIEAIAPQLALALKCTLYGALFSSLYKIAATRFEQRLKGLDYDFDTLCRALQGHLREPGRHRGAEMSRSRGTRQRRAFDVWQIVYIDLMTNVMIFFVVLWAVQRAPKKSGHQRHRRHRDGQDGRPAGRRALPGRARASSPTTGTRSSPSSSPTAARCSTSTPAA